MVVLEGEDLTTVQARNVFFDNRWDTRVENDSTIRIINSKDEEQSQTIDIFGNYS